MKQLESDPVFRIDDREDLDLCVRAGPSRPRCPAR